MTDSRQGTEGSLALSSGCVNNCSRFGAVALRGVKELILHYSKGTMIIDIRSGQKSGFRFCKKHVPFQNCSLSNF